jgi:hypothetical protein
MCKLTPTHGRSMAATGRSPATTRSPPRSARPC